VSSSQTEISASIRNACVASASVHGHGAACKETCVSDACQTTTVEETETTDRTFILKNSSRGIVFKSEHETSFPLSKLHAGTRRSHARACVGRQASTSARDLARGRQHRLEKWRMVSAERSEASRKIGNTFKIHMLSRKMLTRSVQTEVFRVRSIFIHGSFS